MWTEGKYIEGMDLGDQLERYRGDAKELLVEPGLRTHVERIAALENFDLEDVRNEGRVLLGVDGRYPVDAFVMAVLLLRDQKKETIH